jgi:diguanylate cyclase (GGDEF)-like protein
MNDFKPLNKIIEEHIEYEGKNRRLESSNKLLKEMILKVKKEGKHDDLTGLLRLNPFNSLVEGLIKQSKRTGNPLTYLLIDVDKFKDINDQYGYIDANKILKDISKILVSNVRDSDVVGSSKRYVGRFGGDEMQIILPNTDAEGAKIVSERIRDSIETYFKSVGKTVTISAGVSVYDPNTDNLTNSEDLYNLTNNKLVNAKHKGRNKVIY